MSYYLTGKVKLVQEPQTFASGFAKREVVVIVEDGRYPQDIGVEFLQDKVSLLDGVAAGQEITVHFDLRGRYNEKHDRYFNSVVGWKIEQAEAAPDAPSGNGEADRPVIPPETDKGYPDDWDDLESVF